MKHKFESMYIIGITGPTGAGKTTAMHALGKIGALTLDCDEIYHELLLTNTQMIAEINKRFKDTITDRKIDRKKLGAVVFDDNDALDDLMKITHKYVKEEIGRRITKFEKQGGSIAAIDAIALIEAELSKNCDTVVCITAPVEMRIKRIMERDGLSREEALARINAQKSDDFYKSGSNVVVSNIYSNTKEFEDICMSYFQIEKWFNEHADDMITDLAKLIEIDSVRGKKEVGAPFGLESRKVLALAEDMLLQHGFGVNVFEDMVITADLGPKPLQLGILVHLDIVDKGEGWDSDPLKLTERDGKLYGRGIIDDKGPAVAAMYAMYCAKELFPELNSGVRLILGTCEETGFEDIAEYMKKNTMPPNVFSPDAEFPVINIEKGRFMPTFGAKWEKETALPRILSITGGKTANIVPNNAEAVIEGISKEEAAEYCKEFSNKLGVLFELTEADDKTPHSTLGRTRRPPLHHSTLILSAKGTASHASRPQNGNNAQTALIEMLTAMPFAKSKGFECIKALNRLFPHGDNHGTAIGLDKQDDKSGRTTVNFGVLRYDEYEFSGNFDARTPICADDIDIIDITRKALEREGIAISHNDIIRSHFVSEETPFVQTLLRIYEQYTGKPGECKCMGGLTYVHDIPGGVAFGCAMPGDDNRAHGANEYIDRKQLLMCAKMFAQVIADICAQTEE